MLRIRPGDGATQGCHYAANHNTLEDTSELLNLYYTTIYTIVVCL